jgi:hypothetical protein
MLIPETIAFTRDFTGLHGRIKEHTGDGEAMLYKNLRQTGSQKYR